MYESRRKELFPNVTDEQWNDWKWQVKNRIETLEDLKKYVSLTPEEEEGVKKTLQTLSCQGSKYPGKGACQGGYRAAPHRF